MKDLNSNMELLILRGSIIRYMYYQIFKFQYGATNIG